MERQRGAKIIQRIFAVISLDLIFILIPLAYFYLKNNSIKESFKELGIKKINKKELTKNLIQVLLGLIAIMFLISITATLINFNDLDKVDKAVKTIVEISPGLMIYYLIVRVFSEEIFFRGFLVKKTGVFFSSLVFGSAHFLYGSIIEVIGAFIAGLFLAYSYQKQGNLIPVILGHMAFNAVGLILVG